MKKIIFLFLFGNMLCGCPSTIMDDLAPVDSTAPELTSVFPSHAPNHAVGSFLVKLTGKNLDQNSVVQFNSVPAEVQKQVLAKPGTALIVKVTLPPSAPSLSSIPIRIVNPDGQTIERTDLFTMDPPVFTPAEKKYNQSALPLSSIMIGTADFNQDGMGDIAFSSGGKFGILFGTGAGQDKIQAGSKKAFGAPTIYSAIPVEGAMFVDINNDKFPDVCGFKFKGGGYDIDAYVSKKNMDGSISFSPSGGTTSLPPVSQLVIADFTGDAYADLAYVYQEKVLIARGDGKGMFDVKNLIVVASFMTVSNLQAFDDNKDNKLDLMFFDQVLKEWQVWQNQGMDKFSKVRSQPLPEPPSMSKVADFDNDGKLDVLFLFDFSTKTHVGVSFGNGTFRFMDGEIPMFAPLDSSLLEHSLVNGLFGEELMLNRGRVELADVDGDGKSDLVFLAEENALNFDVQSFVLFNQDGFFSGQPVYFDPGCHSQSRSPRTKTVYQNFVMIDTDLDAKSDLLLLCHLYGIDPNGASHPLESYVSQMFGISR